MGEFVIVGAGGIGRSTARELAAAGHRVRLLSRSATDPRIDGVQAGVVDAADAERLAELTRGADALVNAVNPPYTRWATDWPPVARAFLAAAERTGAGLVTIGNLYGYGRVQGPMTEDQPMAPNGVKGAVRAAMWHEALAEHEAGRIRATELRASDYFGPGATPQMSYLNRYVIFPAAAGKRVRLIMGDVDVAHSWTYLADIGRLAAELATGTQGWGHAWHVPTGPALSVRQVTEDVARATGRTPVGVDLLPGAIRWGLRRTVPLLRELNETAHQFENPFVLDSRHTEEVFGLSPTPWLQALRATLDGSETTAG